MTGELRRVETPVRHWEAYGEYLDAAQQEAVCAAAKPLRGYLQAQSIARFGPTVVWVDSFWTRSVAAN